MYSAQELLEPISDNQPAGGDLSFSPELDAIAQARKFDDPSLDQGEWVTELKEADWPFVVDRCAHLLKTASKDLRLAVWLTEAGARVHQLRGLGEGYLLLAGLCDQYWERGLYPQADDGDNDQRTGNLSWILARTPALIREIGLTENGDYSTIDFEEARKRAASGDEALQNRAPRLADMETAKRNNSAQFASTFRADAQFCIEALEQLERIADTRLGNDSPGFAAARDAVKSMLHAMPAPPTGSGAAGAVTGSGGAGQGTYGDASSGAVAGYGTLGGAADGATGGYGAPGGAVSGQPGVISNRTQAVAQLRAVAEFFRRSEPHSPASYFADKAAAAAEQDLHTWLRSVVKDQASLAHIEELLGVPPAE
ncbi:type VI secretion system protein TssA [Duganella radicis]|uniref:Type VI secretion system protein TssA n=1 Tax=Duganella radicis TaxID=551988 RepID=A0A6L6PPF5_9BURK|nr:type VI secretion system protein TssA [Duganella radicis]MTV40792.1 type VI secretion system protein TssA [Duganella radicis]